MHSPFEAVHGHDRTFVRRMTPAEYVQELEEEEKELRGQVSELEDAVGGHCLGGRKAKQYELRRAALTSRDPLVTFSSTFPMYDRLGRELCVMYQIHDWDLQQERERLRQGGEEQQCRRSGVRLSNELCIDSLPSRVFSMPGKGSATVDGKVVAPKVGIEEEVDVSVSAMSRNSSYPRTYSVSARPSEFSIYRDSVKTSALMETLKNINGVGDRRKIGSPVPPPSTAGAPNLGIGTVVTSNPEKYDDVMPFSTHHGKDVVSSRHEAHSKENALAGVGVTSEPTEPDAARWPRMRKIFEDAPLQAHRATGSKRARSTSRLSRVSYVDGYEDQKKTQMAVEFALQRRPTSSTPPPRPSNMRNPAAPALLGEYATGEVATAIAPGYDPIRLTTVRDSVAPRITTQLFRPTCGGAQTRRYTTTLAHTHLIPSTIYGLQAPVIAASKVHNIIEDNYQNITGSCQILESFPDTPTPELRCGLVIQIGHHWFRLLSLFVAAEVYEVVEVYPPRCKRGDTEGTCDTGLAEPHSPQTSVFPDRQAVPPGKTLPASVSASEAGTSKPPSEKVLSQGEGEPNPVAENKSTREKYSSGVNASDVECVPVRPDGPQTLLYRWRTHYLPFKGKESQRAALGLTLAAPEVFIHGFDFADGGLTLMTIPPGYRAVPMSILPLSSASYMTLLKTVLRLLSFMVARRIVHGNMTSLGELLLVHPVDGAGVSREDTLGANGLATLPLVVPVHWERSLDFSMFVDRNAGRTIPYDTEDGSERPLLTYGRDLATILNCFLEHKLSEELNSEQYALLQRLIIMTGEPTQVANFLVQIKNIMSTLTTDLVALQQVHKAAVPFYGGDA
ncbi:unnamed protein product [Phytomonas sp. EM1]|nr:unnamed protein product [Phytomonas sp. EM1]|eukprot:CCW60140.1 unnamed protein product [Phytomonas sp. isolate EM1]